MHEGENMSEALHRSLPMLATAAFTHVVVRRQHHYGAEERIRIVLDEGEQFEPAPWGKTAQGLGAHRQGS